MVEVVGNVGVKEVRIAINEPGESLQYDYTWTVKCQMSAVPGYGWVVWNETPENQPWVHAVMITASADDSLHAAIGQWFTAYQREGMRRSCEDDGHEENT